MPIKLMAALPPPAGADASGVFPLHRALPRHRRPAGTLQDRPLHPEPRASTAPSACSPTPATRTRSRTGMASSSSTSASSATCSPPWSPKGVDAVPGQPGRQASSPTSPQTSSSWPRRSNCRCANPRPKFNPGLGEPNVGALKVMQFIMRKPEVFPNDYYRLWRQAHDEALAKSPYAQEQFRKIVVSKRSRVNDNDAAARAHFRWSTRRCTTWSCRSGWTAWSRWGPSGSTWRPAGDPARFRRLVGVVLPVRPAGPHHRRRSAERLTAPTRLR